MLPNKFKCTNKDSKYFFVDLNKLSYTRKELLSSFAGYKEFIETFKTSVEELEEILDGLCISDRSLFDFTTFNTGFLVDENGIYTSKFEYKHGLPVETKTYFNVYICESSFSSLALDKVAEEIIKRRFPELFKAPFTVFKKRFNSNINELPKSANCLLSNVDSEIISDNNLTIQDLIDIYTNPEVIDSVKEFPLIKVYSSGDIFLTIDENKAGHTVCMTTDCLFNNDWEAIEERPVFSICLYDEQGNLIPKQWYKGEQKNAPYFNNPLVEKLKEIIINH